MTDKLRDQIDHILSSRIMARCDMSDAILEIIERECKAAVDQFVANLPSYGGYYTIVNKNQHLKEQPK